MAPGWDTRYPPRGPLGAPGLPSSLPAHGSALMVGGAVLPACWAHQGRLVREARCVWKVHRGLSTRTLPGSDPDPEGPEEAELGGGHTGFC